MNKCNIILPPGSSWGPHQWTWGLHSWELCKDDVFHTHKHSNTDSWFPVTCAHKWALCIASRPRWQCVREWTSFRPTCLSSDSSSRKWPHISFAATVSSLWLQEGNGWEKRALRSAYMEHGRFWTKTLFRHAICGIECVNGLKLGVSLLWIME